MPISLHCSLPCIKHLIIVGEGACCNGSKCLNLDARNTFDLAVTEEEKRNKEHRPYNDNRLQRPEKRIDITSSRLTRLLCDKKIPELEIPLLHAGIAGSNEIEYQFL